MTQSSIHHFLTSFISISDKSHGPFHTKISLSLSLSLCPSSVDAMRESERLNGPGGGALLYSSQVMGPSKLSLCPTFDPCRLESVHLDSSLSLYLLVYLFISLTGWPSHPLMARERNPTDCGVHFMFRAR